MKLTTKVCVALLAIGLSGCDLDQLTDLDVQNENNPDRERVLSSAQDVENLIGGSFLTWWQETHGQPPWRIWGTGTPSVALSAAADEGTISWTNYAAYQLSREPRVAWPNEPESGGSGFVWQPWHGMYLALSSVYDGLVTIAEDEAQLATEIDVERARAFGRFVQGLAHGFLALMYDSAWVLDETMDLAEHKGVRLPYPEVMSAALGYFDDAIAMADTADWSLDGSWINGNPLSAGEFVRLINGFRARFITQVARTPQERDALNWSSVIAAVDNNLGRDLLIAGDGEVQWIHALQGLSGGGPWTRADYKIIGYSDISGGYAQWLATPVDLRDQFVMQTPDQRITGDSTDGMVDGTDFRYEPAGFPSERGKYHYSAYRHSRYQDYLDSQGQSPLTAMLDGVQQLIKAEGLLRTGDGDGAAAIVNATRVGRGGLPPASGSDDDLMDKLVYESLIENFNVCSGCAFFNRRGWGSLVHTQGDPRGTHSWGLVEGTMLHFPMPGRELDLLGQSLYTYGGVGNEGQGLGVPATASGKLSQMKGIPLRLIYAFDGLETLREKVEYVQGRQNGKGATSPGVASLPRH